MKKSLLFLIASLSMLSTFAQIPYELFDVTFNLKSIITNNKYYTPNGESPNFTIFDYSGDHGAEADGIFNTLWANATFNVDSLTLDRPFTTLHDCREPNCYFENLYFYEILANGNSQPKTLTYRYDEKNGYKYLRLTDANNNRAFFSTEPAPVPNPMLFQTWYLYMIEVDLGDPIFYPGPNPPQITINPDFSYTGIENCALINGDFILGNADEYYDFILQSRNYTQDESNCPPGPVDYSIYELGTDLPLGSIMYTGNDGNDYFQFETYAGFISHFCNALILSTPEKNLTDLKIFPNPVKNILNLQSATNDFEAVSITDVNGRIIHSIKKLFSNEIDVSALKSGMYFINIQSMEGSLTKKFIKN